MRSAVPAKRNSCSLKDKLRTSLTLLSFIAMQAAKKNESRTKVINILIFIARTRRQSMKSN